MAEVGFARRFPALAPITHRGQCAHSIGHNNISGSLSLFIAGVIIGEESHHPPPIQCVTHSDGQPLRENNTKKKTICGTVSRADPKENIQACCCCSGKEPNCTAEFSPEGCG